MNFYLILILYIYIVLLASDKDKVEDKKKFLNIVLLHAEVYYHMKLSNGNKLKVLAAPLIHYLEDLLQDLSEDNVFFIMKRVRF